MSGIQLSKRLLTLLSLALSLFLPGLLVLSPPIANAAELSAIQRRGRLVVAVKENLSPLGFRDANGRLQGFEIDLARQIAQELLGNPDAVEFRPVLNQDRLTAVLTGEADLVIAQMTLTPSRLRLVNFSLPYYQDGTAIATQSATVQSVNDLAGKPIAVLNNSSSVETLRRVLPTAILVPVSSYQQAKQSIDAGKAVAIAADATVLAGWVRELPSYRMLPSMLSAQALAIVLPKGQQYEELRQKINQILTRLSSSRWLEQRANYWGLPRNLSF